jgi:hypothetical protein
MRCESDCSAPGFCRKLTSMSPFRAYCRHVDMAQRARHDSDGNAGDIPDAGREAGVHQRFSATHYTHPVLQGDCCSVAHIVLQMLEAVRQIADVFLYLLEAFAAAWL